MMTNRNRTVDFQIGELEFKLKWSKRAQYRLGKAGIRMGGGPLTDFVQAFDMAAAMNVEPSTAQMSGEDLFDLLENPPAGVSEEDISKLVVEKVAEAWEVSQGTPGKEEGSTKSGHFSETGSG